MAQVDENVEKLDKPHNAGDGLVSNDEWVELLSGDLSDLDTLCHLIKDMPAEQKQMHLNRFNGKNQDIEDAVAASATEQAAAQMEEAKVGKDSSKSVDRLDSYVMSDAMHVSDDRESRIHENPMLGAAV
eukprot:gene27937-34532_t